MPSSHTPDCGTPQPEACPPTTCAPGQDAGGRFWVGAEYLLWWVQGQRIPALVTTNPAGTLPGSAEDAGDDPVR